jgi:hypothetical protein
MGKSSYELSSMYVKKENAPPFAPRFIYLITSTQSFISFGIGRAFLSISRTRRIRVSVNLEVSNTII